MGSVIFPSNSSRKEKLLLLRNGSGSGRIKYPLQHPATQHYPAIEITLGLKTVARPKARMWINSLQLSSQSYSKEEVGFPPENTLCSKHYLLAKKQEEPLV